MLDEMRWHDMTGCGTGWDGISDYKGDYLKKDEEKDKDRSEAKNEVR